MQRQSGRSHQLAGEDFGRCQGSQAGCGDRMSWDLPRTGAAVVASCPARPLRRYRHRALRHGRQSVVGIVASPPPLRPQRAITQPYRALVAVTGRKAANNLADCPPRRLPAPAEPGPLPCPRLAGWRGRISPRPEDTDHADGTTALMDRPTALVHWAVRAGSSFDTTCRNVRISDINSLPCRLLWPRLYLRPVQQALMVGSAHGVRLRGRPLAAPFPQRHPPAEP
jgi:hypothetical protein